MTDQAWKRAERDIARRLGGHRIGPSGRNTCDVAAPGLSCEVKERRELPAWLTGAVRQAVDNAAPGSLAVVILHRLGARHASDLCVLTLGDFRDWFGDLAGEPGTGAR